MTVLRAAPGQRAGRPAGSPVIIALDAMGGDRAPGAIVAGAEIARQHHPDVQFLVFGDEAQLRPLLKKRPRLSRICHITHTTEAVTDEVRPAAALRTHRRSSMRLAIDAVGAGDAQCVISAGNTGALMAMAKVVLKTLPGIDRPAIASFFPTLRGETVMLDLGANLECRPEHLVQFAIMGSLFGKAVLGHPTVGVLNVGTEELQGNEATKAAAAELRTMELPGTFYGFVEGDDIPAGTVDVVVTDGFTGNIALKTAEGTARLYTEWLRRTFRSSLFARLGYLFAHAAFQKLRKRSDPRRYNGAMFLGLGGICVKSHGGTDAKGFSHAIDVAVDLVTQGFNEKVKAELARFGTVINGGMPSRRGVLTG